MRLFTTLFAVIGLLIVSRPAGAAPNEGWSIGQYRVESSYDSGGDRRLTIQKDGKELYNETVGQFWFVSVARGKQTGTSQEPQVADITGDGIPDLVVEEFPL